jgi:catechol 2,3-dioxygenase-like lactoylglutathione lyase family enzyme
MVTYNRPFSGFSVDDTAAAKAFYSSVLGLTVNEDHGMLQIDLGDGHAVLAYPKGDGHVPATFTVLNLPVEDVSAAVRELAGRGVQFARYDGMPQDEDGVMKGNGPDIAWFTDPAGNVMSIISS